MVNRMPGASVMYLLLQVHQEQKQWLDLMITIASLNVNVKQLDNV